MTPTTQPLRRPAADLRAGHTVLVVGSPPTFRSTRIVTEVTERVVKLAVLLPSGEVLTPHHPAYIMRGESLPCTLFVGEPGEATALQECWVYSDAEHFQEVQADARVRDRLADQCRRVGVNLCTIRHARTTPAVIAHACNTLTALADGGVFTLPPLEGTPAEIQEEAMYSARLDPELAQRWKDALHALDLSNL
jgi:hypothetical protein